MINIEICVGSSCFARGNKETLDILENLIKEKCLDEEITLTGRLCMNNCSCGPHIFINGDCHNLVTPDGAIEVVNRYLEEVQ